jgi:hypothetical protein
MVRGTDEWTAGDIGKAQAARQPAQLVKLVGRNVAHHRQVSRRRLKVLTESEQFAANRAEVRQGFDYLVDRLSQTKHQAALGADLRSRFLDVLEDRETDFVLALAPHVVLEACDRLEVMVEHLGSGGEDDVDQLASPVEVRREHFNGGARPPAYGQDALAEMLSTAVRQVVARHGGDDHVV